MDANNSGDISNLVREAVVMLCRNSVYFEQQLTVQGVIGITADGGNAILVHINKHLNGHEYDSPNKASDNRSSTEASNSNSQLLENQNQYQQSTHGLPQMLEAESSQYAYVKQETDIHPVGAGIDQYNMSSGDTLIEETDEYEDNIIYVDSTSDFTTAEGNHIKYEEPGHWNYDQYSSVAGSQDEYESFRELPNTGKSHDMAATLPMYSSTSKAPQKYKRRLSESAGINSAQQQNKFVAPQSVPQSSYGSQQMQFATSYQPAAFEHVPDKTQPRPAKKPRQPKVAPSASTELGSLVDDDSKWDIVKVTKFACKICGQTFNHQPNLYSHQISAHGRPKKTQAGRRQSDGMGGSPMEDDGRWDIVKVIKFACKLCGQTFNHQPNLYSHQITAHGRPKKTHVGRSQAAAGFM